MNSLYALCISVRYTNLKLYILLYNILNSIIILNILYREINKIIKLIV